LQQDESPTFFYNGNVVPTECGRSRKCVQFARRLKPVEFAGGSSEVLPVVFHEHTVDNSMTGTIATLPNSVVYDLGIDGRILRFNQNLSALTVDRLASARSDCESGVGEYVADARPCIRSRRGLDRDGCRRQTRSVVPVHDTFAILGSSFRTHVGESPLKEIRFAPCRWDAKAPLFRAADSQTGALRMPPWPGRIRHRGRAGTAVMRVFVGRIDTTID